MFPSHDSTAVLNASGGRVVTLGAYAGGSTATLYGGVYLGYAAGYAGTDLSGTVAIGQAAAYAAGTLKEAIMIGTTAGQGATSANNGIGIGYQALFGATGANNAIFLGATAGHNALNATYTIGIGNNAGRNAQGSIESIYIGRNAGYNAVSTGVTGDYNIAIGSGVGTNLTSGSKNVLLGYSLNAQSATADGQLSIQNAIFGTDNTGTGTTVSTGKIGIFTVAPTARLHLPAGTATANTAPLKLTTGTLNTTAEEGAIEYNNTFHVTNSDATRRHVVTAPNTTKVTASAPYTNDGYITINIGGTDFKVMTTA